MSNHAQKSSLSEKEQTWNSVAAFCLNLLDNIAESCVTICVRAQAD